MPNTLSKENELQRKAFELYYGLGDKRSLRAVSLSMRILWMLC